MLQKQGQEHSSASGNINKLYVVFILDVLLYTREPFQKGVNSSCSIFNEMFSLLLQHFQVVSLNIIAGDNAVECLSAFISLIKQFQYIQECVKCTTGSGPFSLMHFLRFIYMKSIFYASICSCSMNFNYFLFKWK